jgi:starvation-inducible outer membrane lipoprotein
MTKSKLTATAILVALLAACHSAPQPIGGAHAQQPTPTLVFYPDPADGSVDGQVFEYH